MNWASGSSVVGLPNDFRQEYINIPPAGALWRGARTYPTGNYHVRFVMTDVRHLDRGKVPVATKGSGSWGNDIDSAETMGNTSMLDLCRGGKKFVAWRSLGYLLNTEEVGENYRARVQLIVENLTSAEKFAAAIKATARKIWGYLRSNATDSGAAGTMCGTQEDYHDDEFDDLWVEWDGDYNGTWDGNLTTGEFLMANRPPDPGKSCPATACPNMRFVPRHFCPHCWTNQATLDWSRTNRPDPELDDEGKPTGRYKLHKNSVLVTGNLDPLQQPVNPTCRYAPTKSWWGLPVCECNPYWVITCELNRPATACVRSRTPVVTWHLCRPQDGPHFVGDLNQPRTPRKGPGSSGKSAGASGQGSSRGTPVAGKSLKRL
jgi:hypothetical protein